MGEEREGDVKKLILVLVICSTSIGHAQKKRDLDVKLVDANHMPLTSDSDISAMSREQLEARVRQLEGGVNQVIDLLNRSMEMGINSENDRIKDLSACHAREQRLATACEAYVHKVHESFEELRNSMQENVNASARKTK